MNATMDDGKFKDGIRKAVREALAEKEEANRLAAVEELLKEAEATTGELTSVIATKEEELAASTEERDTLKAKVEELETQINEMIGKLEETEKTSADLEERASLAEKELASIAAESRLDGRMKELEEAKIVAPEATRDAQKERVRDLSDEEFAAYKSERVELRNQLEQELKAASEAASAADAAGDAAGDAGDAGTATPPANIEKARKEAAAAAAAATLDIETASADIKQKYLEMGQKMAEAMLEGRE